MPKFKVGDQIIGNSEASEHYGVTCTGWKGFVIEVRSETVITVAATKNSSQYDVSACYFDLIKPATEPAAEPTRKFKVGDKVICYNSGEGFSIGELGKIVEVDPDDDEFDIRVEKLEDDDDWWESSKNFKHYEDPIADPEPTYKTEHRKAKVGEYVKIINTNGHCFSIGDICKVDEVLPSSIHAECVKGSKVGRGQFLGGYNYDVLIGYDPSAASTEPSTKKPAASMATKPTSKPEHDEHRKLRVRFKKNKFRTLEGEREYRKNRAQIDKLDGLTVIIIGGSGVLFSLDYGVLKVDLRCCELF